MGEEEETGGVQALRAWAAAAVERAKALQPTPDTVARHTRAHDESVTELEALSRLLDHDPALRSSVTVWLGGVLTLRHVVGGGTPEDRERAYRLLRDARDPATRAGADASAEDRRWAALFLLTHKMPLQEMAGGLAPEPDATAVFDMIREKGFAGMAAEAAEMRELLTEAVELPLHPEFLRHLRKALELQTSPSADGLFDLYADLIPEDAPGAGYMRQRLADMLAAMTGGAGPGPYPGSGTGTGTGAKTGYEAVTWSGADDGRGSGPKSNGATARPKSGPDTGATSGARSGPEASPQSGPGSGPEAAPRTGPDSSPGTGSPAEDGRSSTAGTGAGGRFMPRTADEFRRLLVALQAANTTSLDFTNHVGGGDPAALDEQLRRLHDALDGLPEGVPDTDALEALMALLLSASDGAGGTLQDLSVGLANLKSGVDYLRRKSQTSIPMAENIAVGAEVLSLMGDFRTAGQDDVQRLRELLGKAEDFAATVPEGHDLHYIGLVARSMGRLMLGRATMDKELLLSGLADFEAGRAAAGESNLPLGVEWLESVVPDADAFRAYLTDDPANLPDREPPPADATAAQLHTAVSRLGIRYSFTKDPEDLEAVITTLERLREHIRQGRAPRVAGDSLWQLAEAYRARWQQGRDDSDARAATDTANEALATIAADVLLQHGAEDRLTTARNGASLGIRAALWAAAHNRVEDAVAALELGRALVLKAAATSRAVPELLEDRGHHDLAAAWRESGADDGTELPAELPSTLRRRALEALGYRQHGGLLGTPTLRELADGVGEAGADALIYLVPGDGGEAPGMLLVVGPEVGIGVGPLPVLSEESSAPLERYIDAADARARAHGDERAEAAWEEALSELCHWAHLVFVHVLAGLDEYLPGDPADRRTPRVVLVPCGRLGIVPWHAARFPERAPFDYLCQALVISYAASGGEFLRTARRAPRHPVSAPALVADPTITLTYAELEVLELRNAFYPGARLYGDFAAFPRDSVPAGTPEQLLSLLAQDHSMVHLATHGMAGTRPTESALHLAPAGSGEESGRLTVTRLLDRPQPDEQAAKDGPLIVMSACETDLSNRDHDEALTLTTAFVSGGARDVVGSRWRVEDSASSLLMAVFHHHLRAGLSPVDALRAAQLWMLDPGREDPGCLSEQFRGDVRRPDLRRPALWAAFIHQGHPGQGKETV
ncbi:MULTISPECIES: CHAT domain-containing protein [unclassified Streptomyces]|uniref:CHAT domain-containing protein n=1 Tax=unclassified Streptomyces TaxID=2593676 RepID=UPI00214B5AA3|nr:MULTISPECIES: CHAT domain-containing protein [unclassified Streptomyces]